MAETTTPEPHGKDQSGGLMTIVLTLLVGGVLLLALFGSGGQDRNLDRAPAGLDGLGPWLSQNDVANRVSNPRLRPGVELFSLRVLPLYDLDMNSYSPTPETNAEHLNNASLRDISLGSFNEKLTDIRSVVLLPKWRNAINELGIAHDQSLIPVDDFDILLRQLNLSGIRLLRDGPRFTHMISFGADVSVFQGQFFDSRYLARGCKSVVSTGKYALVISCRRNDTGPLVYFVSDPDVLNNHGLALAQNAEFAVGLLTRLRDGDGEIYIDRSPYILTLQERSDEYQDYDRGSEEASRFFTYPFTMFWAVLLIVLAMLFWRGARRFGPLEQVTQQSREQSKRAAIEAKARLLRLSGNDGRMVADFVSAQIEDLARRNFGPATGSSAPLQERFLTLIARRDAKLAQEFSRTTNILLANDPEMTPHQRQRYLTTYHSLLKKVMHDHGSH